MWIWYLVMVVVDPKFARGGGRQLIPKVGALTKYFHQFFSQTPWKERKLDSVWALVPGARVLDPPPWSVFYRRNNHIRNLGVFSTWLHALFTNVTVASPPLPAVASSIYLPPPISQTISNRDAIFALFEFWVIGQCSVFSVWYAHVNVLCFQYDMQWYARWYAHIMQWYAHIMQWYARWYV